MKIPAARSLLVLAALLTWGVATSALADPVPAAPTLEVRSADPDDVRAELLVYCDILGLDCPTMHVACPGGQLIGIGTCWNWEQMTCETCESINSSLRGQCSSGGCPKDEWLKRADGCSAGDLKKQMTDVFRAACNIQDICYATPGRSKLQCDTEFHHNMTEVCRFPGVPSTVAGLKCDAAASAAYAAVKSAGEAKKAYEDGQEWASRTCSSS